MIHEVDFKSQTFIALCESHCVKEMYVFGSVVTDKFTEESDVDILVEINEPDPIRRGKLLLSFYNKSIEHFNRSVDIVTRDSLSNPYLIKSIEASKILVYKVDL